MILDDDELVGDLVTLRLSREGVEVTAPRSAAAALFAVTERVPDLILLDLRMPDMDGLTVLRAVKQRLGAAARVIMLTGEDDTYFVVEAREAGALGYLTKPLNFDKLVRIVHQIADEPNVCWVDDYHVTRQAEPIPEAVDSL